MLSKAKIAEEAKNKHGLRMAAKAKDAFKDHLDSTEDGLKVLAIAATLAKAQKKKTISEAMAVACAKAWKQGKASV